MTIRQSRLRLPLLVLGVVVAALAWFAATSQSPVHAQTEKLGETSVVVPAGGEATIDFETFCLEFGLDFPSALGTPDGRAPDAVLRVLKTAIQEGLVDSEPLQTQLAIWSLIEGGFPYSSDEIDPSVAAGLIERSAGADISPIEGEGVALDAAVADGRIEATSTNFASVETDTVLPGEEPYKGSGTLVLRNTTDANLTVFFSLGIVFRAGDDTQQDIVAYATELEEQPTPTPMPTATSAPTPTATPPDRMPDTGADLSNTMLGGGTDGGDGDGDHDDDDNDDNGDHDDNDSDGDDRMPDTGADLSNTMLGGGTDGGDGDHDDNDDDDNGDHDDNDSDGDDRMPDTGADLSNTMLGGGTDGGDGDHDDDDNDNGDHDDNDSDGDDRMPDTGADLSDVMLGGGTDGDGDHDDDDNDNGDHNDNDSDSDDRMPDTGADLSDTMLGGGTDGGDGDGDHDDDDNGNGDHDDNDSDGDDRMPDTGADLSNTMLGGGTDGGDGDHDDDDNGNGDHDDNDSDGDDPHARHRRGLEHRCRQCFGEQRGQEQRHCPQPAADSEHRCRNGGGDRGLHAIGGCFWRALQGVAGRRICGGLARQQLPAGRPGQRGHQWAQQHPGLHLP